MGVREDPGLGEWREESPRSGRDFWRKQDMQLKLFTLPVKNLDAAEAEMNAFLRSHRVLTVKKELVADGENSFWRRNNLPYAD